MFDKLVRRITVALIVFTFSYFRLKRLKLTEVHCGRHSGSHTFADKSSFRSQVESRSGTKLVSNNSYDADTRQTRADYAPKFIPPPLATHKSTTATATTRENCIRYFYYFSIVYPMFMIVKYAIICSLDSRKLAPYRYISCYLVGRFTINGRVTGFSNYVTLLGYVCQLYWRLSILQYEPTIELECLEFLLYDQHTVLAREIRAMSFDHGDTSRWSWPWPWPSPSAPAPAPVPATKLLEGPSYSSWSSAWSSSSSSSSSSRTRQSKNVSLLLLSLEGQRRGQLEAEKNLHDPLSRILLLNYEKQTLTSEPSSSVHSIKLNRTAEARRHLAKHLLGLSLLATLIWGAFTPLLARMIFPVIYTRAGFQLNYPNCVNWIRRQPNRTDYSHILAPQDAGSRAQPRAFLPLAGFVPMSGYHLVRTSWDVFDTLVGYLDVVFGFTFSPMVALILCADVQYYTRELNARLQQINTALTWPIAPANRKRPPPPSLLIASFASTKKRPRVPEGSSSSRKRPFHAERHETHWDSKLTNLQAIILDYLVTVQHHNGFASKHIMFIVTVWFTLSGLICSRLVVPRHHNIDHANEPEWFAIGLFWTFFTFTIMGSFARIRTSSRATYRLINAVMARDRGGGGSGERRKKRWLSVVNFFHPKPIYCFTWLPATEISWLSVMKVIVYLLSALVVAASLLSANEH